MTDDLPTQVMPAPPTPSEVAASRRRRWRRRAAFFVAGVTAGGALLALAFAAVQLAEYFRGEGPVATTRSPAAGSPAAAETVSGPEAGAGGPCTPRTLSAPEPGGWRMASRQGDIQLSTQASSTRLLFRIQPGGEAEGTAEVSAEVLSAADVRSRFGLDPPGGGETAIVISFSEEFRASGGRFRLGRVGAVTGAVISGDRSGVVAIAGVRGSGCPDLRVVGWEAGGGRQSAEVVVDIPR